MAATVEIAGKKLPKSVVYIGGAVAVGAVGYAWFTSSGASSDEELVSPEDEIPEPVEVPTDTPGFSVTGGGPPPTTNADWSNLAVERMVNLGHSGQAVSSAIGEYLARRPLSKAERDLVQQAISLAGPPPQGTYTLIDEPLPTPVATADPPGPVRNLMGSTSRTEMLVRWSSPNTGGKAVKYVVEFYAGTTGGGTRTVAGPFTTTATERKSGGVLLPNHSYGARVRAIGANGKSGITSNIVRRTTR